MTTLTGAVAAPAPTPVTRRRRGGFWVLLAVLTAALIVALVYYAPPGGNDLDPTSATPGGSRAVATLLAQHGVPVHRVAVLPAVLPTGPAAPTLVIVAPDRLSPDQRRRLQTYPGDLVLLGAQDPGVLADLGAALSTTSEVDLRTRAPECAVPAALRAGSATSGGVSYQVNDTGVPAGSTQPVSTQFCYPDPSGGSGLVVVSRAAAGRLILFGTGALLTNQRLAQQGNASLTLSLLSGGPSVLWVMPPLGASEDTQGSINDLLARLPGGIRWGTAELGIALLLLAAARVRRLGPPVTENLPVSVRSAETTAGRARLYRAARARGTAANTLRDATRRRLAARLRLPVGPTGPDPESVSRAVAARTRRPLAEVERLLYGLDPPGSAELATLASAAGTSEIRTLDDATLLDLDDQLNELERQVSAS
jgi:Domain of unknown function (DUF4350)